MLSNTDIIMDRGNRFLDKFLRVDSRVQVVIGVAGAGKTSYAMDQIELLLREGYKWNEIGFLSFSRAACAEAAERAEKVTGESKERLQNDGWFRTVHSAAVRALGIDAKTIIDPDSAKGREWFTEVLGAPRGGDSGTLAGQIGQQLDLWDFARQHVVPVIDPQFLIDYITASTDVLSGLNEAVLDSGQVGGQSSVQKNAVKNAEMDSMDSHFARLSIAVSLVKRLGFCAKNPSYLYIGEKLKNLYKFRVARGDCPSIAEIVFKSLYSKELRNGQSLWLLSIFGGLDGMMEEMGWIEEAKVAKTAEHMCRKWTLGDDSGQSTVHRIADLGKIRGSDSVIDRYERAKRLYGRIDFSDILMRLAGLELQDGCSYVQRESGGSPIEEVKIWICDEWQDSSTLLDMAAQALWRPAERVMLLGDGYQAVYGFSGAQASVLKTWEHAAAATGRRAVLARSWRNPEQVLEWGEQVLREDEEYEERKPIAEGSDGSVGLVDWYDWVKSLDRISECSDVMIVSRTWFTLEQVKRVLDERGIPWQSLSEKCHSRWDSPAKIAFVLTMRDLADGQMISEQDFRRITEMLPQKHDGMELFRRGEKARWKKLECSPEPKFFLTDLEGIGAAPFFRTFVERGLWRTDMFLLLDTAINKFGIDRVRRPAIRIGTCHSVKGMQARVVFCLATSTDKASEADWSEDLSLRYVTITRASAHYRLIVNQLDLSRGKPMFWAAPRGVVGYDHEMEFLDGERERNSEFDFAVAGETGVCTGEDPCGDLHPQGDARRDLLRAGQVRGSRGEEAGRAADTDSAESSGESLEEWWSF